MKPRHYIPLFSIRLAREIEYTIRPETKDEFAKWVVRGAQKDPKVAVTTAKRPATMSVAPDPSIVSSDGPSDSSAAAILSARIAALLDQPGIWASEENKDGFKIWCTTPSLLSSEFTCFVDLTCSHSEVKHSVIFVNKKCANAACYSHGTEAVSKKTARALWRLLSGESGESGGAKDDEGAGDEGLIDDTYAATVFVKACGPHIQREGDTLYYFDETTGMWSSHEDTFRLMVRKHKEALLFHSPEGKILNYGGMERNIVAMRKSIRFQVPETNFMRDADKSLGKLLFADGIFDFATGFTPGFDPALVFLKRIDRPFPVVPPSEELIAQVDRALFVAAFDDGTEDGRAVGQYLKRVLTMGIYGDYYRKKFYVALGESNCGKGVIVGAMLNAFGGYVDEFNANELLYNPGNSQDESRRLAWLRNLAGVRLAFSSELRMDGRGADGNLIKSITSGGDAMKIRGNYEDEKRYVNRTT